MPVRRRLAALQDNDPDPRSKWTWVCLGAPVLTGGRCFKSERAARRAWEKVGRVAMWDLETIGDVPAAAQHYDGITAGARDLDGVMWLQPETYRAAPVLKAVARDRDSVAAFRAAKPAAAQSIARYLAQYLATLIDLERNAQTAEAMPARERWQAQPVFRYRGTYANPQLQDADSPRTVGDLLYEKEPGR